MRNRGYLYFLDPCTLYHRHHEDTHTYNYERRTKRKSRTIKKQSNHKKEKQRKNTRREARERTTHGRSLSWKEEFLGAWQAFCCFYGYVGIFFSGYLLFKIPGISTFIAGLSSPVTAVLLILFVIPHVVMFIYGISGGEETPKTLWRRVHNG